MIATVAKRFTFDAAHRLDRLPPEHKCHRMHGHTYEVEIVISGVVDDLGFVVDYADIAELWEPLHQALDHRTLNDVTGLEVPTTENLAGWICVRISLGIRKLRDLRNLSINLDRVVVRESTTTSCEVRPHNLSVAEAERLCGGFRLAAQ